MPLILTLTSRRGGAPPEARTLSDGTITLGRGTVSDWVLADPERLLSKTHCMIGVEGSRYVLTDLSMNGVFLNGARDPTARDSRVFLTDGDHFQLGDYTVTVTEVDVVAPSRAAGAPRGKPATDPFGAEEMEDPFGSEPGTMFRHPVPARGPRAFRNDDPFATAGGGLGSGPAQTRGGSRLDTDDDLFQGLPADLSWQGAAQPDNADAVQHAFAAPKSLTPARFEDLDLDALLGDEPPGQPQAAPPQAAPSATPLPRAAIQPERAEPARTAPPVAPQAELPPPPPAAAPAIDAPRPISAGQGGDDALLRAFMEGAGLHGVGFPNQDADATMRLAGTVFRAMAEGLREVLMSRAAIKNELRVEQTMLQPKDNNALKFSVTPEEAVAALLFTRRTGYKVPVDAVREACRDIQSHEMAVMAGVQTALVGLLRRFDPAALEARLQPGRLDGLLPVSRRARVWELFCATYADIAREAEDDFQSVFGREFAKAYDAQMRKL
jgi:type VI secretion system FHA domain protein